MDSKVIEWNREELYERIWSTPLRTVAKEYGLSDVGLAKICKKLKIPRPGLGYWRRKECGAQVSRVPLPKINKDLKLVSHIPVRPERPDPNEALEPLTAPVASKTPHPLVSQTQRAFARGGKDQFGRITPSDWRLPRLDLRVTEAGLGRALDFMDRLIKLALANGMSVSVGTERDPAATMFAVEGEEIRVILKEFVRAQKQDLPTNGTPKHAVRPDIYRKEPDRTYDSTGRFAFEIESYSDGQRTWADTKRHKIEQNLEQIVYGLRTAAAWAKRIRAEREAERQRYEREERLRQKHR